MGDEASTPVERALAAASVLIDWYVESAQLGDAWWMKSGFWHSANVLQSLIDLEVRLGGVMPGSQIPTIIDEVHSAFGPHFDPGTNPTHYDDEGWWAIAFHSAYELTSNEKYLDTAKAIAEDLNKGWSDELGGVWWKRNPKSYPGNLVAAISTELFMDLAGRLHRTTGDPKYKEWAVKAWDWLPRLITPDHLVWGQLNADGSRATVNPPYTYTQGVVLGGLVELHNMNPRSPSLYLDAAIGLADAGLTKFAATGPSDACVTFDAKPVCVLREDCEATPPCSSNAMQFKGIFVRYLRGLHDALRGMPNPNVPALLRYEAFINLNAYSLWASYPEPRATFGTAWHVENPGPYDPPDGDDRWIAATQQSSALDALIAAIGL